MSTFSVFVVYKAAVSAAIFIMVVSPTVRAHDVLARADDLLMEIALFLIGWIYSGPFKNWETVKLRQRSTSVRPTREKVKPLKQVKLRFEK